MKLSQRGFEGSISLSNVTCFDERNEVRKEEIVENVFRKELKLA